MRQRLFAAIGAALLCAASSSVALAEAGTLSRGDLSMGAFTVVEPFNSYWYYRGPESSQPYDVFRDPSEYSRFGLGNYEVRLLGPEDDPAAATSVTLWNVGVRFEYGVLDTFSVFGDTQIVHGDDGEAGGTTLGDTHLGAKVALTRGSPVVASLVSSLKIPGLYDIQQLYSPGTGQPDLDFKLALGGLAARRRLFYDLGLGYRFRFPYADPQTFQYTVDGDSDVTCLAQNQDACELYEVYFPLDGPANETFLDATVGYFTSRRLMVFGTVSGVDSHSGASWDDITAANLSGANGYLLLTELEEDYLRGGVGVLVRPRPSMTVYGSYSYIVWGRNTAAVLKTDGGLPIGTFALGMEVTLGSKAARQIHTASLDPDRVLAMKFSDLLAP